MNPTIVSLIGLGTTILAAALPFFIKRHIVPMQISRYPREITWQIVRYGLAGSCLVVLIYFIALYMMSAKATEVGNIPLSGLTFGVIAFSAGVVATCLAAFPRKKKRRRRERNPIVEL